jgi:hypothetical protein
LVVFGKRLQDRCFAQGNCAMLFRVTESASSEVATLS